MKIQHHIMVLMILIASLLINHLNILGIIYGEENFVRFSFNKSMEYQPIAFHIKGYDKDHVEGDLSVKGHYENQIIEFAIYQTSIELLKGAYALDDNELYMGEAVIDIFNEPIPFNQYIDLIKEVLTSDALEVSLLDQHHIIENQPVDVYQINEEIRVGINYQGYILRLWYQLFVGGHEVLLEIDIDYL